MGKFSLQIATNESNLAPNLFFVAQNDFFKVKNKQESKSTL